jgi:hypothetical protein
LFRFFAGATCLLFSSALVAQDTTAVKKDTIASDRFQSQAIVLPQKKHSPRKAAIMSACLPGLGQAYNKKYWKIPVIYVGFGALAYSLQANQAKYVRYRDAYKYRIDLDPSTTDQYVGIYSDENLASLYRYYHRYRDLSVIGIAAVYLLNVVDASVDAHLFHFDVNDDLTMNIRPSVYSPAPGIFRPGIGISIGLR